MFNVELFVKDTLFMELVFQRVFIFFLSLKREARSTSKFRDNTVEGILHLRA